MLEGFWLSALMVVSKIVEVYAIPGWSEGTMSSLCTQPVLTRIFDQSACCLANGVLILLWIPCPWLNDNFYQ